MSRNKDYKRLINHLNKQIGQTVELQKGGTKLKNKIIYQIFQFLIEELSNSNQLDFTTLFARISFIGATFKIRGVSLYWLHYFRKKNEKYSSIDDENLFQLGIYLINLLCNHAFNMSLDTDIDTSMPAAYSELNSQSKHKGTFQKLISTIIVGVDMESKAIRFYDTDTADQLSTARYDIKGTNKIYTKNIERLNEFYKFPVECNMVDVSIDENGDFIPRAFVFVPDFLVDVTAIAGCYDSSGTQALYYLLNKFKPFQSSVHLLLGNVVNYFLDEIVRDRNIEFQPLLKAIFSLDPLGFSLLTDADVISLLHKAEAHFDNLKTIVWQEFGVNNINQKDIYLEPSFFSRDYGIQGRLDILHDNPLEQRLDIVELKSGSIFKPNVYGLNQSHYVQTLLYDLMMQSISDHTKKAKSYILYSKESQKGMRFAPLARAQQLDAMNLRNSLISIEHILASMDQENSTNILESLAAEKFPNAKGFNLTDIKLFEQSYKELDEVERSYFNHFTAFIAREHKLAKLGTHGLRTSNGQASLWLETASEKEERFALLRHLVITDNEASKDRPFIRLKKTNHTSKLVNFRKGDIVVLYPDSEEEHPMLRHQIFKCSLVEIQEDTILILLRNKQNNLSIFKEYDYWNIEADMLDKSFNTMYKNLFQFAQAEKPIRDMILCRKSLSPPVDKSKNWFTEGLSDEKAELLSKMLMTKDYFLLWGPPGTGKTSLMIKYLVKNLYENTNENILLLAYTNRAVDEICDAIVSISPDYMTKFIRVGSTHSTGAAYRDILLQNKTKNFSRRSELRKYLVSKRIYVATISSMIGRGEIFKLKSFDTLIIDEASQILEPMIVGLLPRVKRFILIGDHKQLPAVVVQKPHQTIVEDKLLKEISVIDTRISLFERLYLTAKSNEWTWLYDTLNHQGRMHSELMKFPNEQFYNNELELVPDLQRLTDSFPLNGGKDEIKIFLSNNRRAYFPTNEVNLQNTKTNEEEAEKVIEIIKHLEEIQENTFAKEKEFSIGVITPYRAQIALVKAKMEVAQLSNDHITVDTVERYQGGSRDIIIISFCINSSVQINNLVSLSSDGTDRKLNVALTRAKEQIILIGNQELLSINPVYKELIHDYEWFV